MGEDVIRQAIDQWRTGLDTAGDDAGPSMPAFILAALRALPVEQRMEAMGMVALGGADPHGRTHYVEATR